MSEKQTYRPVPAGWVGFHPDDPAKLAEIPKWLDYLDRIIPMFDDAYEGGEEIQNDLRRIAGALRDHLGEPHPLDYLRTYEEVVAWMGDNGWSKVGRWMWRHEDRREVIVPEGMKFDDFEWSGAIVRLSGRWKP